MTSARLPEDHWRDTDAAPLAAGLRQLGVRVEQMAWDADGQPGWAGYDALVMQSPWSMWVRMAAFRRWLADRSAQGCRLLNPVDVVRLGSDKRYLTALAEAGVPTVPTTVLEGPHPDHPHAWEENLRAEIAAALPARSAARRTVVVKPIASGGSLGIREFPADRLDAAAGHARALIVAGSAALVQPYIEAIDRHRELAVVFLNGRISHAISKAAILRPGSAAHAFHPDPRPHDLTPEHTATALRAHQAFAGLRPPDVPPEFSTRLDFLIDPSAPAGLSLLEVEAVAPVKFLALRPDRVPDFAATIVALASAPAGPECDRTP